MARALATAALVKQLATEFAAATNEQIAPFLRVAQNLVSIARFGDETDDAHAYATAHLMKMDPGLTAALTLVTGTTGVIKSKSHGPASISYDTGIPASMTDAFLSGSIYGQFFKVIRDRKRGAGSAVRIGNNTPQTS